MPWPTPLRRLQQRAATLAKTFYYRKYFEWGLPMRRFAQVNIVTNSVCNRTCHFCLFGIKDEVPAIRMPATLFFKIVDELAAMNFAGRMSLFCINESLTDKRIYDFIRYTSLMLPNAYHALVTNGDILNRERLDALFANGLDLLLINSYDAKGVEHNRPLYDYALQAYPGKIMHTDRSEFKGWVGRAGHVEQYAKPPKPGYCDLPNYAFYVKSDGKLLACCHDFDNHNVVGDLNTQSVKEAWHGQQFAALRKHLNAGDRSFSELCNRCDHEPDLNYFHWNANLARTEGKAGWPLPHKPDAAAREQAQAIKTRHLEREQRPSRAPVKEAAVG